MIVEEILELLLIQIEFLIRLLPSAPTEVTQWTAVFDGFILLNNVIDVPILVAQALLIANLMVSGWFVKKVWDTGWNLWMAIKW